MAEQLQILVRLSDRQLNMFLNTIIIMKYDVVYQENSTVQCSTLKSDILILKLYSIVKRLSRVSWETSIYDLFIHVYTLCLLLISEKVKRQLVSTSKCQFLLKCWFIMSIHWTIKKLKISKLTVTYTVISSLDMKFHENLTWWFQRDGSDVEYPSSRRVCINATN